MEDKWDTDVKSKKSAPKKGRRAGLGFFTLSSKDGVHQEEKMEKELLSPRFRESKITSWAEETLKSNRDQIENAVKDFDDGILVIPNLEENSEEELISKTAQAPLIGVNRVDTYKELENDLLKHTAFTNLEEVNLRVLTNHLYPEPALLEPDEPWTKETLLSEVISATNDEKDIV